MGQMTNGEAFAIRMTIDAWVEVITKFLIIVALIKYIL